jgi:4-amino-4-deoxy-L-arabinose transferase-like glycosyltransferase
MLSKSFNNYFLLAILISFCVLIALARLHTYNEPFERDLMTYAVMAHEMLAGRELYSDLWDQKPPGPSLTYAVAELITGYGPNSIYLLNVVATIITLFGVYFAGTALAGGKRSGGLWAAACWAMISGEPMLQANQPNIEVFINACLIWVNGFFLTTLGYHLK